MALEDTIEYQRLQAEATRDLSANWKRWGPYLSEREWGTVREDYSPDSKPWYHFTHDQARSRAYRWGEDGLLGITDRECRLCFSVALWNGKDAILKERLFGLTGPEGNHGEDVKEYYYYLDSTPTHSYMRGLYKYPQAAYPYDDITHKTSQLSRSEPEYELIDTGIFKDSRYFDVEIEYAKNTPGDLLIQITVTNRGPQAAPLHILPTLWYRNTWVWGCEHEGCWVKPRIWRQDNNPDLFCDHETLKRHHFWAKPLDARPPLWLFTENETNNQRLYGSDNISPFVKDAFHEYIIKKSYAAVSPKPVGTKAAAYYQTTLKPGQSKVIQLRLSDNNEKPSDPFDSSFDTIFAQRKQECDAFYREVIPQSLTEEEQLVSRQAYAGLLWSKQFYHYVIKDWLNGDPNMPPQPESRLDGRNSEWEHLFNRDIISMPDKWEYPWYAAWDLAFHMLPFAHLDIKFAKEQLLLFLREWYMHPNGQIPAYEWQFSDVNPPVHAWACWRIYEASGPPGKRDVDFLKRVFVKLLLNFTWWVNRKDVTGKNVFAGGFLGLDNIGVFDRSKPLPTGGYLEQADGTAWMAFYSSSMMSMALELAHEHQAYGDMASKFFEHYIAIAKAMNTHEHTGLWDEEDGFYYDHLRAENESIPLKIRSIVGLMPLLTVDILYEDKIKQLPGFYRRTDWFLRYTKDITSYMSYMERGEGGDRNLRLLSIPTHDKFLRILKYMLDENEFLSPYGIRSLSKVHEEKPFVFEAGGEPQVVKYVAGESDSWMFGGNSNWRGPVWFPFNYLLIEALDRYYVYYGDELKVECPTGSGNLMTLHQVAREIERRLTKLFLPDENGKRPSLGNRGEEIYATDPHWQNLLQFYEYFHGDNGRGLGASHQTGWTALVASMLRHLADGPEKPTT
jgi:hypothetical protein